MNKLIAGGLAVVASLALTGCGATQQTAMEQWQARVETKACTTNYCTQLTEMLDLMWSDTMDGMYTYDAAGGVITEVFMNVDYNRTQDTDTQELLGQLIDAMKQQTSAIEAVSMGIKMYADDNGTPKEVFFILNGEVM